MADEVGRRILELLWLTPGAFAIFAVKFIRDIALSVEAINQSLALVVQRIDSHEHTLDDHEVRIRYVERGEAS